MEHEILFWTLIVIFFVLIGFIFTLARHLQFFFESVNWPAASGTMVKMRKIMELNNEASSMFDCIYSYHVDGKEYKSNRIGFGNYNLTTTGARKLKKTAYLLRLS